MRLLNVNTDSNSGEGCDRLWEDGDDVLVQLRPAAATHHQAIAPSYVPDGEILGRVSTAAFLDAARALGLA